MDSQEMGWAHVIELTWLVIDMWWAFVTAVMYLWVP
jgi:hypothetical protein